MGSQPQRRRSERRSPKRPINGDTMPCPDCGNRMEFNERYRFDGAMTPAWVCEHAGCRVKRLPARRDDPPAPTSKTLVKMSKALRATASRTIMTSRARVTRFKRRIK